MTDPAIEEAGGRSARAVDPAVLARIADALGGDLVAVKPAAPAWLPMLQLLGVCASIAGASAAWAGLDGVAKLTSWQRGALLVTLGVLATVMARECVARWTPGSRVRFDAVPLIAGSCGTLVALFGLIFRDYRSEHFVAAGLGCLEQGVLHALPAAILGAWVLRRGFATRPAAAAVAGGALAGLAGVAFLELHCPNFEAPHQLLWHTAVIPVSAALGALIAWVVARPARAHS